MDLEKTIEKINKDRQKVECCFVFSCWDEPDLYEDYKDVNQGKDKTLLNEDAEFYWELGRMMHEQGVKKFDAITIDAFLSSNDSFRKKFDSYGGYNTVRELGNLIDSENVDSYYDKITKMNSLTVVASKYEKIFENIDKLNDASNDDVYGMFELLNSQIAMSSGHGVEIENLGVTKEFLEECRSGEAMGLSYKGSCPLLNYITLGLPLGDCFLVSASSGTGKSSFVFENFAVELARNDTPVVVFSNEMRSSAYNQLLTMHILTHDLNYYNLTRKKLKVGEYTAEDEEMLEKAMQISKEKYEGKIIFIKLFDNNTTVLMKYLKKFARQGVRCFIWDTFKNDDLSDGKEEWLQLLKNSRRVFNLVSQLKVSMVMTFQQALYTTNQRFLDASCLAGSKQVKEVVSELIMMRRLWSDEYTGEKNDCKAYKWDKETKEKNLIKLNPEKKYIVVFINKTRNDEDAKQILYQWDGAWNKWYEVGSCVIKDDHRGMS